MLLDEPSDSTPLLNSMDAERRFYKTQTESDSNNLVDLKNLFYTQEVGLAGATEDLERIWLVSKGVVVANNNDMYKQFLLDEGYSGALQDMKKDYFNDNA